eukprot:tig00000133_g7663.t1
MPWWRPKPQPPQPKTTFYTFSELYCKENTRVDVKVVNNAPASRYQPRGSEILRLGSGYNLNECYTECREDAYLARTSNRGGGMMQPTESQAKKGLEENELRVVEEAEAEAEAEAFEDELQLGLLEADAASSQLQLAAGEECDLHPC